ncbi:acetoacetyl-CoA synthetase [Salix suchowensis]|nr:acetoacetyl-CoA synthetase [Salix suchowensis]
MWNFLISGLTVGCTLVLYDGSPLRDPAYLWNLTDQLGITVFGTSAKYIDQLSVMNHTSVRASGRWAEIRLFSLERVHPTRETLSADSPAYIFHWVPSFPGLFDYVYESIHPKVLLASITGVCTALPVYRGEIQCRMLGMAIESFSPSGSPNPPGENGELVCVKPFPCMPLGFWPLPGYGPAAAVEAGKGRFQQSYFSEFKDVWYHGDHLIVTESKGGNGGGVVMLGRSDGVLNPGGVRFGSAELYDLDDFRPHKGYRRLGSCRSTYRWGTDERVVLFVKLLDEHDLSAELVQDVKAAVRSRRSPRHVPARILQVGDIPYTLNGKRVEVPVKKVCPRSGNVYYAL